MKMMDLEYIREVVQSENVLVSMPQCHHHHVVEELRVCYSNMIQFEPELLSIPQRLVLCSQQPA